MIMSKTEVVANNSKSLMECGVYNFVSSLGLI